MILGNPLVTVRSVQRRLDVTNQGTRGLIQKAESLGWLTHLGPGSRAADFWIAQDIMQILDSPTDLA